MKTVEVVKEQINQYDIQSSKYKTTLRNITAANSTNSNKNDDNNNSVTIEWVKVRQSNDRSSKSSKMNLAFRGSLVTCAEI
jgi:competence protein ComGC